jgi:hypothetical protein
MTAGRRSGRHRKRTILRFRNAKGTAVELRMSDGRALGLVVPVAGGRPALAHWDTAPIER